MTWKNFSLPASGSSSVRSGPGLVHGGERSERDASGRSGQLRAKDRIDDVPRVDGVEHGGIALAVAGQVEQARAFHEERALLRKVHGEALVDFHLERVAFHLAEIGIHRRVQVTVEVSPHLALTPGHGVLSTPQSEGVSRSCARIGPPTGSPRAWDAPADSENASFACFSNTPYPLERGPGDRDTVRLTRRQRGCPC